MITARPKGCCSSTWSLFDGDRLVASFEHGWWREAAKLIVGDQLFHIDRSKWNGPWRLRAGEEVVLEARKPSAWRGRFEIPVDGDCIEIIPEGWAGKSWLVTNQDGTILGRVGRRSWWKREAFVDLPDGMPISVQAFLLCLGVFMWNRQAAVGAGGA